MNKLKEFLKPDKERIILALILPLFWFVFSFLIAVLFLPENVPLVLPGIKKGADFLPLLLSIFFYYAAESALYYPFACSIAFLYEKRRELNQLK